ncbi:MAG: hypothetical protein IPM69_09350 [Ignavibacteria bacterium]|nr:hypothetical protein [Ignavibacteria bacterium]
MDTSHIHLFLNHFPIIGTLIATLILAWGILQKNHAVKMLAAALLVAMALIAIPVYLTGEQAEKQIEHLPDFVESIVESHEDASMITLIIMELTAAAALCSFIIGLRRGIVANKGFIWVASSR